jgi:hypothetical protein
MTDLLTLELGAVLRGDFREATRLANERLARREVGPAPERRKAGRVVVPRNKLRIGRRATLERERKRWSV